MIRLLIADDHPVVREGVRRIVEECPDITVVGEVADGDELFAKLDTTKADVLLLDIAMPGPGFLNTMQRLRTERAASRVLVLSMHSEEQYALRALRAGASGYLTKGHSPKDLTEAIRRINRGGKYITPALAEKLVFELDRAADRAPHESLSDREYQVLCMLGSGKSIKQIGAVMDLSPKTISTYRTRILEKMKRKTTADLIRYAVEHQLDM